MLVDGRLTDMTAGDRRDVPEGRPRRARLPRRWGTQKNALRLVRAGLNVVTLPKTIDNDVALTDATFRVRDGPGDRDRGHRPPSQHGA